MSNKNPAVLWYPADYLIGVIGMTWEEQGRYVYLLNIQHQKGHFDLERVMADCPDAVLAKFKQDENGLYYNERMEQETAKRQNFVDSRRNNAKSKKSEHMEQHMPEHMEKHMPEHMENENENINTNNKNELNNPPTPLTTGRSDEAGDTVKAVVEYLNQRTGSSYRPGTRSTADKIKARLNEGFTLDDFKVVIDKKAAEWTGTDYEKFLRPETLFGSKFEGYLNQKTKGRTKNKFAALLQEGTL